MKFFFLTLVPVILIAGCNGNKTALIKLEGNAQGTTYHISYLSDDKTNYKDGIDSILKKIDSSMSTYLPVSLISRINKNDSTVLVDRYFIDVFNKSMEVSAKTDGLFDVGSRRSGQDEKRHQHRGQHQPDRAREARAERCG
jgi:thiamine biosynthesis lipoprotein